MGSVTAGQAIRNAVEAEKAAARFYELLAASTGDVAAITFLRTMASAEVEHARSIEEAGRSVSGGPLPALADTNVAVIETVPSWRYVDGIALDDALRLAHSAEVQAALYYDAIADQMPNEAAQRFFRQLSAAEEEHARRIVELLEQRAAQLSRARGG